ncbi:MAG TPA: site-specific integrase [Pseudonocardia sp.]
MAPSTLRLLVGLLRSVFASAVLDRLVATTPVVRIKLPDSRRGRVVPLTIEQVQTLSENVAPRARAMIITQAGLGLRLGEILGLRVSDVNFLNRTVRIEFQRDRETMGLVAPKTPRSRRTIPLPRVVADALAAHLSEYSPAADGGIFTGDRGKPYMHTYVHAKIIQPAVKASGLPGGTTTHDLRHHFASVLLQAGESVVAVAEYLGHENATLVLSTYGHLMLNSEDRMRQAIDEAWAPKLGAAAL